MSLTLSWLFTHQSSCPSGAACSSKRCSMTAIECLEQARAAGVAYQQPVNVFVDGFRRAGAAQKTALVAQPIDTCGPLEGLVAGAVSALCREAGVDAPAWVALVYSPTPFFAFPA